MVEQSKAKLAKSSSPPVDDTTDGENGETDDNVPFFAAKASSTSSDREELIKSRNEETGLITTDGEKMAKKSEEENWKGRRLGEVFENEINGDEDVYSLAAQQLGDKDVARSIFNLRKSMKTEDYNRIFDKRNRFIGEDN